MQPLIVADRFAATARMEQAADLQLPFPTYSAIILMVAQDLKYKLDPEYAPLPIRHGRKPREQGAVGGSSLYRRLIGSVVSAIGAVTPAVLCQIAASIFDAGAVANKIAAAIAEPSGSYASISPSISLHAHRTRAALHRLPTYAGIRRRDRRERVSRATVSGLRPRRNDPPMHAQFPLRPRLLAV